jgi:small subunit ribosomal protein S18
MDGEANKGAIKMADEKKNESGEKRNDGPPRGGGNYRGNNNRSQGGNSGGKRRVYMRRKVCRFCADKNLKIDYKETDTLRRFITEGGKIIPRRITGNCAKCQRRLTLAVKQARAIALLPYVK